MLASRITRLALVLPWFVLYAWLIRRAVLRRPGATIGDKVGDLLRLREPSIFLDSARVLVFGAWLWNAPDPAVLKETLTRSLPMASPIGIFKVIPLASVPLWSIDVATWTFRAAMIVALLGLATRAGAAVAALCHVYLWSAQYSFGYSVHNHVVPMALLAFALCPDPSPFIGRYVSAYREGRPLTQVGSYPAFTVEAVRFAFVTVYVQAGMEKALQSGLRYFNGITLQTHFLWGLQRVTRAASWPLWLLGAMAFFVVLWECGFGLVHFYPRARIPFTLSALVFHEIVRHTMAINPFSFLEVGIVFFIPPYELALLWRGRTAPRTAPPGAISAPLRPAFLYALLALCALQWAPFFLRGGTYPILSFSLFSGSYAGGETQPRGGAVQARSGPADTWRRIDETRSLAMHHIAFGEFISSRFAPFYFEGKPLSLPGYAKQDKLEDHREEICQFLLGEVRRYTYPDVQELSVLLTYYVVSDLEEREDPIYDCRLPPAAAPPPAMLPAAARP